MSGAPVVLVPGAWLGAWAWDEVAAILGARGVTVNAITLPGLESREADRSAIGLEDHVTAICDAVQTAGAPVVLCLHSYAGCPGYVASDRLPDGIAHIVYVDTAPATGALDPERTGVEWPLPPSWDLLEDFRRRAVPHPAGTLREAPALTNPARHRHTS